MKIKKKHRWTCFAKYTRFIRAKSNCSNET